ncbi:MAG: zf-HC2 domain-containing protein [Oscillospiraceae bacterium]|nr:zf-HC2 domain-containing protein [Oscillospiraceae bacterium]
MNECERIREQLSAYLDGELTETEAETVRAHLDACPACRAEYAAYLALSEALEPGELPEGLHESVMAKLAPDIAARRKKQRLVRLRPALSVAAVLVVIVGAVFAAGGLRWGGSAAPMKAETNTVTSTMSTSYGEYAAAQEDAAEAEADLFIEETAEEPAEYPMPMATAAPMPESEPASDGFDERGRPAEPAAANAAGAARDGGGSDASTQQTFTTAESWNGEAAPEAAEGILVWPDEITHAVVTAGGAEILHADRPDQLALLAQYVQALSLAASRTEGQPEAERGDTVLAFFNGETEVLRVELLETGWFRIDGGRWYPRSAEDGWQTVVTDLE